jgi:two-component system, LytTR family, sensor kinase
MQRNNQNWSDKIRSTQALNHLMFFGLGALSWFGFSYVFMLFIRLQMTRSIYNIPWTSDAPHWVFLNCLIGASIIISGKYFLGLLSEKSNNSVSDFLILTAFIPVNSLILTVVFIWGLGMVVRGDKAPVEYELLMSFLMGLLPQTFVALTCIGYFYLTLVNQTKERLLAAQQAKTAMELKTLQQNIEPHFLFNNLNVLSSLIDSNPQKANDFLSKLAELYRYILQTQTLEVVPIMDELTFARNYIYLLQERFGDAYNFDWQINENKLNGQMIVPVALQTLIENAVKHNAGDNENPLQILIKSDEDSLSVENEFREKQLTFQTNKSGLHNLKTRYAFLTDKPIEIIQTVDSFKVKLPLILKI